MLRDFEGSRSWVRTNRFIDVLDMQSLISAIETFVCFSRHNNTNHKNPITKQVSFAQKQHLLISSKTKSRNQFAKKSTHHSLSCHGLHWGFRVFCCRFRLSASSSFFLRQFRFLCCLLKNLKNCFLSKLKDRLGKCLDKDYVCRDI